MVDEECLAQAYFMKHRLGIHIDSIAAFFEKDNTTIYKWLKSYQFVKNKKPVAVDEITKLFGLTPQRIAIRQMQMVWADLELGPAPPDDKMLELIKYAKKTAL